MIVLSCIDLVTVFGGCDNGTKVSVPGGSVQSCTSDYALCTQTAAKLAEQQYPDTRPKPVFGIPLPFTNDDNAAARAKATADTTAQMCGPPR